MQPDPRHQRLALLLFACSLAHAPAALSQQPNQRANQTTDRHANPGITLQPVEATIGDTNPLALSQRILRADLRVPTGFERVYRISVPGGEPRFARIDSGITAIFPQSTYIPSEFGPRASIPPGTVFSIGGDLRDLLPKATNRLAENSDAPRPGSASNFANRFVDRSTRNPAVVKSPRDLANPRPQRPHTPDASPPPPAANTAPSNPPEPVTIWTSDLHRQRRIADLLGP